MDEEKKAESSGEDVELVGSYQLQDTFVDLKDIHTEGITRVTAPDIEYARELGYRIKLLAIAKASDGAVEARVHPTMIPAASPLAAVSGVFNGVFLTGDAVGDLMFYGRGAGQMPTASAVWSDVLEISRRIAHGIPSLALELPATGRQALTLAPMETIRCGYYLRVMMLDKPGTLSRVTGVLGENDISIASVIQKGRGTTREAVPVVMLTHEARERDMRAALAKIDRMRDVAGATQMIRVEGGPA
jgi:homoserine dehydrogenase